MSRPASSELLGTIVLALICLLLCVIVFFLLYRIVRKHGWWSISDPISLLIHGAPGKKLGSGSGQC